MFTFDSEQSLPNAPTLHTHTALQELDKMGVNHSALACNISDDLMALVLMKASLAEFMLGLQDGKDWSIVMADDNGHLVRERSFSSVRFAVVECLLLVAVVALGWSIWTNKTPEEAEMNGEAHTFPGK